MNLEMRYFVLSPFSRDELRAAASWAAMLAYAGVMEREGQTGYAQSLREMVARASYAYPHGDERSEVSK